MSNSWSIVSLLTDRKLDERLRELAHEERGITAELLAHLAEVDARRLCGGMAEGTTFNFCVRVLRFTEDEACKRIRVARTAREFPTIYDLVAMGEQGQTAVSRLAPLLTRENRGELLEPLPARAAARVENGGSQLATGATGRGSETEGVAARGAADDEGRGQGGQAQQEMRLDGARVDSAASVHAVGVATQVQAEPFIRGLTATGFKTDAHSDSSMEGHMSTSPNTQVGP